ncbi:cytochrome P450 family protein [Tieghemostelium lacteum]|uniref:Cytochrome P450 family protein n=1 Tax=Tieghemostelium lacteum TaxID=361077 RepID=A0A151ZEU8_TIELA|nr:cytochrome P450 family protein [Tieghemostelium lacteum]|eukprot:KYQ92483.1 cytochrome P450 family protein [Tieghemostelium lacteum]
MFFLIISVILIIIFLDFIWKNSYNKTIKQPLAIPLFGNLHLLGKSPHESLTKLSHTYGSLMGMWYGNKYSVFVNDVELAKEIFFRRNENFMERPRLPSFSSISNDYKNFVIADEYWWKIAKKKVANTFQKTQLVHHAYDLIHNESMRFVEALGKQSKNGEPVQPREFCQRFSFNIILQYVFSRSISYDVNSQDEVVDNDISLTELVKSVDDFLQVVATGNIFDYISIISPLYKSYMSNYGPHLKIVKLITTLYNKHKETIDIENPRDLVDNLIIESMNNTDTSIDKDTDQLQNILIGFDFFIAGSDTSSNTIEWFILMMANYPDVQEKCYKELKSLNITTGQVLLSHQKVTPYLNATIKEVMRLHPVAPIGFPRVSKDSCILDNGAIIPAKSQVLLHTRAIFLNEKYFESPMQFNPDRYLNDVNLPHQLLFGLGSRSCAGNQLATDEIFAATSNLLYSYKITTRNPNVPISDAEGMYFI